MQKGSWIGACRELAELLIESEYNGDSNLVEQLHEQIYNINPDILIDAYSISDGSRSEFFTNALLKTPEWERRRLFKIFVTKLTKIFPDDIHDLDAFIKGRLQKYYTNDKLYRYLKRIDGAIAEHRYSLAIKLTNRCLREYYCSFLIQKAEGEVQEVEVQQHKSTAPSNYSYSITKLSVSVCQYIVKYFEKHGISYSSSKLTLIALSSNTIFLTYSKLMKTSKYSRYIDKSIALFARNNLSKIVRYMQKYW